MSASDYRIVKTDGEWHALHHERPEPVDLLDAMSIALHAFCAARGFGTTCAEELLHIHSDELTETDREWLEVYCRLWDASQDVERDGAKADVLSFWTGYSFEVISTGGGCEAFYKRRADGAHVLVTDDAALPASMDVLVRVGFYNGDGEWLGENESAEDYRADFIGSQSEARIAAYRFLNEG